MPSDRERWDEKYANRAYEADLGPTDFVSRLPALLGTLLPARPAALDVATGTGRNAVFLAQHEMEVTGLDVSPVGLELARRLARDRGVTATFAEADLETADLGIERYDLVLNSHYLQRSLFPRLSAALRPGGILAFETFCRSTERHPMKPAFLLRENELLTAFPGLTVLFFEELPDDAWGLARIIARKPGPGLVS